MHKLTPLALLFATASASDLQPVDSAFGSGKAQSFLCRRSA
jgi:hypothetical protein